MGGGGRGRGSDGGAVAEAEGVARDGDRSVEPDAFAVTGSGALPEDGVTLSAAVGWPTVSWAVAMEVAPTLSVTVTLTV